LLRGALITNLMLANGKSALAQLIIDLFKRKRLLAITLLRSLTATKADLTLLPLLDPKGSCNSGAQIHRYLQMARFLMS
jgi:hypothetical protein